MKLLIAVHSLVDRAGAPLHTLDLCRGFRSAGHEVSVFTFYPGVVTDGLEKEGFPIFLPRNYIALEKESFDLVYLFHATCEALLGLMFSGRTPIVRGYIGKGSTTANPINAHFSSALTYISEGVRETMQAIEGWNSDIPSIIARNVYDDRLVDHNAEIKEPPSGAPNFAVVSNHAPPELIDLLKTAAKEEKCRFTHFGHPHNSTSITVELLMPFDAVITVGRTVLLAAALAKPVYLCDIHGTEGWLSQKNYADSRRHSFSGRRFTTEDWAAVARQLLDRGLWPSAEELSWIREMVEGDHALSRRVEELETFFAKLIAKHSSVPVPSGYRSVFRLLGEEEGQRLPGRRSRRRQLIERVEAADNLKRQLQGCRQRLREYRRKHREQRATIQSLRRELRSIQRRKERGTFAVAGSLWRKLRGG